MQSGRSSMPEQLLTQNMRLGRVFTNGAIQGYVQRQVQKDKSQIYHNPLNDGTGL